MIVLPLLNQYLLQPSYYYFLCMFVQVDVVSGDLECPESGRKFPITRGIPNMLVNENEVNEINGSNGC